MFFTDNPRRAPGRYRKDVDRRDELLSLRRPEKPGKDRAQRKETQPIGLAGTLVDDFGTLVRIVHLAQAKWRSQRLCPSSRRRDAKRRQSARRTVRLVNEQDDRGQDEHDATIDFGPAYKFEQAHLNFSSL